MQVKKLKKTARNVYTKCLPQPFVVKMIRNRFSFDPSFEPASFEICRDESTQQQIESLVHDAYVKEGYIEPQTDGRLGLDQYDQRSITFLTRLNGEIVATLSVVIGGEEVSLPCSGYIKKLPVSGPVVELTRFTVAPKYRGRSGVRMFEMFKHVFAFVNKVLGIDPIISSVNPKHVLLYKGIFFFERLPAPVSWGGYGSIKAPAVPLILTSKERDKMIKFYRKNNPAFINYMSSDESMRQSINQIHTWGPRDEQLDRVVRWGERLFPNFDWDLSELAA